MKMGRLAEISRVFLEEGFALSKDEPAPHGADPANSNSMRSLGAEANERTRLPHGDREKAQRLARALLRLGPTFVKFGQLLSTRIDLFGPEFLDELGQLRAHVPPFSTEEARKLIETELGRPAVEIFDEFPDRPIASASMAQVYRAKLKDAATWVAVKVARPHLRETLERDLDLIVELSGGLEQLLPVYRRSMVHQVALEYAARSRQESDLLAEALAMEDFGRVTEFVPEFVVPRVHREQCSRGVLTMDWLDGTLLDTVPDSASLALVGVQPNDLGTSVLRLQLIMSYEFGLVHGDTHAGNLILLPSGKIGLIDFGLNGVVPRKLCDQMLELLFYQASGRTSDAVRAFSRVFGTSTAIEQAQFEQELAGVLRATPQPGARNPLTGQLVAGLRLGAKYQLRAQSELFLVLRNLTIVEGLVLLYCPQLDVVRAAEQTLQEIMARRAMRGLGDPNLAQMAPLLLLNLSKRPELVNHLLRLERSFSEAGDLGEFLEQEGVFRRMAPPKPQPLWVPVVIGMVAALVTALLLRA